MGYARHNAIIVSSKDEELVGKAYLRAMQIFHAVSNMVKSETNNNQSFFIPPDGSYEGWEESKEGDEEREQFKYWLKKQTFNDGSILLSWVEVQYGDDDNITKIVDSSDDEHNRVYQEFNKERS